jgi:putative addiction module component (TIGR02574 family)
MMSFDEVRQAAIELPPDQRTELIESLIASLAPESGELLDDGWMREIERRSAEIDAGTAELVPWEEVRRRIFRSTRNDSRCDDGE